MKRIFMMLLPIFALVVGTTGGGCSDDDDDGAATDADTDADTDTDTDADTDADTDTGTETGTGGDTLLEGLVGHWLLDEGTGTTSAEIAGDTVATLEGGASWIAGAIDQAVELDGVDGFVDGTDLLNDLALPVSLSAWVRVADDSGDEAFHIFATDDFASAYLGLHWMIALPAGTVEVKYGSGQLGPNGRRSKVSEAEVPTGSWVHVAAVVRGAEDMDIYIDGVDAGGSYSGGGGDMEQTEAPFHVGRYLFDDQYSKGGYDDLRVYDRELTADEVLALSQMAD